MHNEQVSNPNHKSPRMYSTQCKVKIEKQLHPTQYGIWPQQTIPRMEL